MRAARELIVLARAAVALAVLALAGCRVSKSDAASVADDIDAIEAALATRETELADEGIIVAYRDTRPAPTDTKKAESPGAGAQTSVDEEATSPMEPGVEKADDPVAPAIDMEAADAPPLTSSRGSSAPRDNAVEREDNRSGRKTRRAKQATVRDRCENRCALVEPTCGLRDRICDLAERHLGDERYLRACDRAEDQCDATERECSVCAM